MTLSQPLESMKKMLWSSFIFFAFIAIVCLLFFFCNGDRFSRSVIFFFFKCISAKR